MSQLRTVQVLGGGSAGSSAHVRSLVSGLVARGVNVTVCAPAELDRAYDYTGAGARFAVVPRRSDPAAVGALRAVCVGADVVHAHGLHAGVRTALALSGTGVPLVVTWHTLHQALGSSLRLSASPPGSRLLPQALGFARAGGTSASRGDLHEQGGPPRAGDTPGFAEGARGQLTRLLERRVARAAAVVLGTSSDLVDRARRRGARDARLASAAVPAPLAPAGGQEGKARAELGAVERPLLMTVGSLVPHRGYGTLLDAARLWRELEPEPLVVIAGEGPERGALRRRIEAEALPVRLLGRCDDVTELLAVADIAVLSSRWEARSLLAQEALRLGVPLVATAVGGVPELVGDAAELVPYGDAEALAEAVTRLLASPERCRELAEAGRAQAATWPTEDDMVAQVLSIYDELTARPGRR
ncbi:glycosyltransferase family 4 protein [Streptomyces sannanensis]|uniref:D-inositol 3-phosphate glycosyltransferase n=1 Tax=Streptomyces sannanensis TaxID=285536 RepID=A0ABP6S750_9ACTN